MKIIENILKILSVVALFIAVFYFGFTLWKVFIILLLADLARLLPFKNYEDSWIKFNFIKCDVIDE